MSDGTTTAPTEKFDPYKHTMKLRGFTYLPVSARVLWMRTEHPEASIEMRDVVITEDWAVFACTVTLPNGATSTDYGSETKTDFKDYLEKASSKALGRALANLGYGIQFAEGEEIDSPAYGNSGSAVQRDVVSSSGGRPRNS